MNPGRTLSGKYRLDALLGQGGMGSVWRAHHLGLEAPVAIKLMDSALAQHAEGLSRFHREAHAAALIRSPHVVQVLDHGLDDESNTPFIVMELLEGETLGKRLQRERRLPLAATASIVADVCRALARAHQAGIIHRDLKPENIFIVEDEREFAKVLDFGVAKANAFALGPGESTRTGAVLGTPYYMSPEQIRGAKDIDARSDLWSVGVIACECITGRRPFEEETLGGLAVAICTQAVPPLESLGPAPLEFEAWLVRALQRDPAQRFQTARELSDALLALAPGEAPRAAADDAVAAPLAAPPAPVSVTEPRAAPKAAELTTSAPLSNTFGTEAASVLPKRLSTARLGAWAALLVSGLALAFWFVWGGGTEAPGPGLTEKAPSPATERAPAQRVEVIVPSEAQREPETRVLPSGAPAKGAQGPKIEVVRSDEPAGEASESMQAPPVPLNAPAPPAPAPHAHKEPLQARPAPPVSTAAARPRHSVPDPAPPAAGAEKPHRSLLDVLGDRGTTLRKEGKKR